jgi:PPIC-type PPIASE domain
VSHILISHRDARPDHFLRPGHWAPDEQASRSRAEAEVLAQTVAAKARAHPETFDALAAKYSDDEVTRRTGGSLGGRPATQLPGAFLDALSVLGPGDLSRVVETSLGFHILLRRSPPPGEDVAGRHVVVRYAGTEAASDDAAGGERTRNDARKIANSITEEARAGVPFASLVDRYSEHADRALHGELGVWSNLAPADHWSEVETLSRLTIGEISTPIDSVWGFQVLEREEPGARPRYAAAAIRLRFDAERSGGDPRSKETVYAEAQTLARKLHDAPSELSAAAERYGGPHVEQWEFGHGNPQVTMALDELREGEVAARPMAVPHSFIVLMRLNPALLPNPQPPTGPYALPLRVRPDVERLFHDAETSQLLPHLDEFMRPELVGLLALPPAELGVLKSSAENLRKDLLAAKTPEARLASYQAMMKRLSTELSVASYSRMTDLIEHEATRVTLTGP